MDINLEDFPIDEMDFFVIPLMGNTNMNEVVEVDTQLSPTGLAGVQNHVTKALEELTAKLNTGEIESGAIVGLNKVVYAILRRKDEVVYGVMVDGGGKRHYIKRRSKTPA